MADVNIFSTTFPGSSASVVSALGYTPVNKAGDTMTGPLVFPVGSAGAPSFTFTGDTTTGFYRAGSGIIDVSFAGAARMRFRASGIQLGSAVQFGWASSLTPGTPDAILLRRAAASIQLGSTDAAAPVSQTLSVQGSRAGIDTNIGGGNFTVRSGAGTGTGTLSSLLLQSPVAVASGTGAQTQTTGLTIINGTAVTSGYTVATLPAAATAGARAHVTDALAPAFGANVAGGGAVTTPVFYDGTAWVVG
ncbi:MAG: hypothetical protein AB7U76_24430 [Pirellulales bacterium]